MTALSIVQNVCSRIALAVPNAVFSSTDQQIVQMRALLNQEGNDLVLEYPWQELVTEGSFTAVASSVQTTLPTDFGYIINDSMWNRTQDRLVSGPLTAQEWQRELAGPTFTAVEFAYRIQGGQILVTPDPAAGDSVYYEYVSANWCESSGGTGQPAFAADTDVGRISEELLTRGLLWRFLRAKGVDFTAEAEDYQQFKRRLKAQDGGKPTLSLHQTQPRRLQYPNIPEGSWS